MRPSVPAALLVCLLATLLLAACSQTPSTPTPTATPLPTPTPTPAGPLLMIGTAIIPVELATNPQQWSDGLSRRDKLAAGTGMLFVFEGEAIYSFWMKEMRFPLDMVWITAGCVVEGVTADIPPPAPDTPTASLPMYSPQTPVLYVLEINAGEAAAKGIQPGSAVQFRGPGLDSCTACLRDPIAGYWKPLSSDALDVIPKTPRMTIAYPL